ncbi:MAG: low specificity L-threonine aldolase [Frankia sp.]|nr:low specificity L-threonine aldolase [Frankia sp.]
MESPGGVVDLRSDTLTRPSAAMRRAMADAEVGDDVYGEDPTVQRLEAHAAELFGHEAALFVPSGTMGNQIAVRLLVPPAEELLCDTDAHIVTYESGGAAQHGAVQTRTLRAARGLLEPGDVAAEIRPAGFATVVTRALAVEQTHNRGGGAVYPVSTLRALRELTAANDVAFHCDGARIFNAHVASGVALSAYGGLFDTLSVCLSKGLGAPVGSLVVSTAERVAQARVLRRRLGGGMRQAGVIAAAGLYALQHNVARLADDHERAQLLAGAAAEAAPDVIDPADVETNIVAFNFAKHALDAAQFVAAMKDRGVLVGLVGPSRARLVTHLDVDDEGATRAAAALRDVLAG